MQKRSVPQAVFDSPEALRVAKAGHREACQQLALTPRHLLDPSNPNHPDNFTVRLFGHEESQLLAKQYRSK